MTWATARGDSRFSFSGGVILIGNRPLGDLPELAALQTRICVCHLQPSTAEMRALMRSVALGGHEHGGKRLGPAECLEVCDFVLERALSLRLSLDMRLLVNSFRDRLQWEEGDAASHWQALVASRLNRRPTRLQQGPAGGRAARKQEDQEVARRIAAATSDRQERRRLWKEQTDKSEPTLYRRLADLGGSEPPIGE